MRFRGITRRLVIPTILTFFVTAVPLALADAITGGVGPNPVTQGQNVVAQASFPKPVNALSMNLYNNSGVLIKNVLSSYRITSTSTTIIGVFPAPSVSKSTTYNVKFTFGSGSGLTSLTVPFTVNP